MCVGGVDVCVCGGVDVCVCGGVDVCVWGGVDVGCCEWVCLALNNPLVIAQVYRHLYTCMSL